MHLRFVVVAGGMLLSSAIHAFDTKPPATVRVLAGTLAMPWFQAPSCHINPDSLSLISPLSNDLASAPSKSGAWLTIAPLLASEPPLSGEVHRQTDKAAEVTPAPQYNDVWERIVAGFQLRRIKSSLVAKHQAWYLNRPEYIQRIARRSQRYLYFIVEELEKRDMPTEIALLPIIESAYDPAAYSRMHAAGIWQFISSTGRQYGLEQDQWYDGRRDVLAATRAALDYLQYLHRMFADWELALAAYNWGEGNVQRAIAKNRANRKMANYLSLNMPNETRNYLPKLQAVKNIVKDAKLLGLELQAVPNLPYFAVVNTAAHIDVIKAAQFADMAVEEFRSLNPGHTGPVIIQASARQIILPIDKVSTFQAKLDSTDDVLASWQPYVLKPGETLTIVARRFGTSVHRLRRINGLNRRKQIPPGETVLVPLVNDDSANPVRRYSNVRDL